MLHTPRNLFAKGLTEIQERAYKWTARQDNFWTEQYLSVMTINTL